MAQKLKQLIWEWRGVWITATSFAGLVILLRFLGFLESWELGLFDRFLTMRPQESVDHRIAIVGIDEKDMQKLGQGIVPDRDYARLLKKLKAMEPRAIGFDVYRDLPVPPGHEELVEVFSSTPNLVGIEKVIGDSRLFAIPAPPKLKELGQVGANDLMLDADQTVRRAFLTLQDRNGEPLLSLGAYLALLYLEAEGISVQIAEGTNNWWQFNSTVLVPFEAYDSGYIRADAGDYQTILNYRGSNGHFETVSMMDVLENKVPSDWARDRVVLVGYVGEGFQDLFATPYTLNPSERMAGVEIHANVASSIISVALDNRPIFKTWSEPIEYLWILLWATVGATLTWRMRSAWRQRNGSLILAAIVLAVISYMAFLQSWWIPVVPPFLALSGSAIAVTGYIARSAAMIRKTFGRYLTAEIVSTLLEDPEGLKLGGERRKITILTSDLRGFTAISERLSPEDVVKILNFYLGKMADVITQYGGTIDEFMGDGILVLFGAPTVRKDDAERAIACAVAMQLAMEPVNQQMKQWDLQSLEMGIGINTGEVVVGNIGSEKRTKYGVVGSQVNLTYRIESYTIGGQILISETTLVEVGSRVECLGERQVTPKGVKKPLTIYEVGGIGGKYNLFLSQEEEIFLPLREPILLQYSLLKGKDIENQNFSGNLVELSEKGAIIESEDYLPDSSCNLKINFLNFESTTASEDVYAKVISKLGEKNKFSIRFTAKPSAVEVKLHSIYAFLKSTL